VYRRQATFFPYCQQVAHETKNEILSGNNFSFNLSPPFVGAQIRKCAAQGKVTRSNKVKNNNTHG
jgi:hypothetical protein